MPKWASRCAWRWMRRLPGWPAEEPAARRWPRWPAIPAWPMAGACRWRWRQVARPERGGETRLVPSRRGTARIATLWLRWSGPLGLGHRQVTRPLDQAVRIWPDITPVRSPALQIFLRDAAFGLVARRIRGEGTEFEALAEYEPGMDRRRIDWKSSARHGRLFAKEYETERNNQIVFAFDCGQAMTEPLAGLPRLDRAITAALTTAWVALKAQDRVAVYGFAARPLGLSPFVAAPRDFARLQRSAAAFDYHGEEPNFTYAMATLATRLQRRSLVVVFSDFTDPTSAELMIESLGRLLERHRVLFVVMADAELSGLATASPDTLDAMARAVTATALQRQRAGAATAAPDGRAAGGSAA
jgi:uncharacterized protein (DUF58 family)